MLIDLQTCFIGFDNVTCESNVAIDGFIVVMHVMHVMAVFHKWISEISSDSVEYLDLTIPFNFNLFLSNQALISSRIQEQIQLSIVRMKMMVLVVLLANVFQG